MKERPLPADKRGTQYPTARPPRAASPRLHTHGPAPPPAPRAPRPAPSAASAGEGPPCLPLTKHNAAPVPLSLHVCHTCVCAVCVCVPYMCVCAIHVCVPYVCLCARRVCVSYMCVCQTCVCVPDMCMPYVCVCHPCVCHPCVHAIRVRALLAPPRATRSETSALKMASVSLLDQTGSSELRADTG